MGRVLERRRTTLVGSAVWKPNFHLSVDLNYEHNRIELPQEHFTTDLLATRFTYAFTSRAFLNAFVQYNVDTHQVSSNIRFHPDPPSAERPVHRLQRSAGHAGNRARGAGADRQIHEPVRFLNVETARQD